MDELTDIANWLRAERGSWAQIASRCEVSTKTINRIVHAKVDSISLRTLGKLRKEREAMTAVRRFEQLTRTSSVSPESA